MVPEMTIYLYVSKIVDLKTIRYESYSMIQNFHLIIKITKTKKNKKKIVPYDINGSLKLQ